jgi:tetratricopeptide (TPR) repeat protein
LAIFSFTFVIRKMLRLVYSTRIRSWICAALILIPLNAFGQNTRPNSELPQIEAILAELKTKNLSAERIATIRAGAFELVAAGRFQAAAQVFEGLLAAVPRDQQAAYGAALSLFNLKQLIQARELAKLAVAYSLQDKSKKADALVLLGVILAVEGDNAAALSAVREAAQLAPAKFDAQFALGRALYGAGDLANAIAAFRKAVVLQPQHPEARFFLATTLEAAGDYRQSRDAYLELIRLRPGLAEGHLGLGVLLTKLEGGKSPAAIAELTRAVALDGNLYEARVALGKALVKSGRPADAIAHLQLAASLAPGNPEPHYQLALAYRRLGNTAAAASATARVNEINASRRGARTRTATAPEKN